ncbi:formate dehydrogenase subunit gamma [Sulfitobacter mediterraneus]|jgi:formate dehydrogenase subunit gamma|uniref:formate dehydrogenase subunit gamma n=1 Tax=Sulfitobacter mediterraneus TaxID=83219 RepID=UPI001934AE20|nr:formate dehydrogenase subunit gamma [Sulfitobacter mediterraneus]MBM1633583.1 formate dehydrogenase subunit gamma [Sulfitobacter mediterraneus]MBM1641902.1 formate dehydrogenase subunit gamma [Sulfitobacter mediterraneus]MBM1645447.1 formate dehydrogenase subunit gamma [Sulfitobacter mediterraneus]MBM1650021.1 formate dehydrogenase subunit gamma [Sulfitobacter mediterraneus]MBM1653516.1 formate dehydrogenase subunit gamma [Sulfitobacter mediterraneus]
MLRVALALVLSLMLGLTAQAQTTPDRSATGGAQTLADILARQRGEPVDDSAMRSDTGNPADVAGAAQLGPIGGTSDPEVWRAIRYGSAETRVSAGGEVASVLVQDGGMKWLSWRDGPLRTYGGWLLIGTLGALVLFYLLRGRIRIDEEMTGRTVTRFKAIERFGHWLLAGSFVLLGLTGLVSLFGRVFIAPYLGREVNATLLNASKWIHNNVAWAFIIGLVMIFVMWVVHNIPNRTDLVWLRQFGGIIGKNHPPAKKFNAGQKLIFWSVILFGTSIAVSGVSLLFPYELPLFAKTFAILNDLGLPGLVGMEPLPVMLSPQEEMQFAQGWHAIMAFVLMAIILAHIYIGSVGMEGAYDAMGSGEVDEAWAHQHHSIWLDEMKEAGKDGPQKAHPAE